MSISEGGMANDFAHCRRSVVTLACSFAIAAMAISTPTYAQNILFYGNSFTNGFLSSDNVPSLVQDIAVAAGQPSPLVHNAAVNSQSFSWHLANNLGEITTPALPSGQEWDYAVLQNFSTAPTHLGNVTQHRSDSVALYQAIANHSSNVTPVLFETWARGPAHSIYAGATPSFPGGPAQMQAEVRDGYQLAAQDIDAAAGAGTVRIAEVGDRWEDAAWSNLHAGDIYHANNRGTLLTSLVIYSTIYEDDTRDIDLSSVLSGLGLSANDGLFLTGIADGIAPPETPKDITLKFDFGATSHPDINYNLVSSSVQGVANAVDYGTGLGTHVSMALTSATGFSAGPNTSGTTGPGTPASDFFDGSATTNNLFGHNANFGGSSRELVEFTIDGLEQNRLYDFTFFASRLGVGDNRETQYELTGLNSGTDWLDAANNTDEVAQVPAIQPNADGEIVLIVQKGPNNTNSNDFYYLGAMELAAVGVIETADFDSDGDTDGADFLTWQQAVGSAVGASLATGDGNGDGAVDSADLAIWQIGFASSGGLAATGVSVPEPASYVFALVGLIFIVCGPWYNRFRAFSF